MTEPNRQPILFEQLRTLNEQFKALQLHLRPLFLNVQEGLKQLKLDPEIKRLGELFAKYDATQRLPVPPEVRNPKL
jgi:hypothetical protein